MKIEVPADQFQKIEAHLEEAYPNEGAGFLLGHINGDDVSVTYVLPMDNRREAEAQHNRYSIEAKDYANAELEAAKRDLSLVGVFHSHPDHPARPSQFDLDYAWPNFSYFITSVQKGKADVTYAWRLRTDRSGFDEDRLEITQIAS
jgi:proteasome lid subunit RPN8/RPN11